MLVSRHPFRDSTKLVKEDKDDVIRQSEVNATMIRKANGFCPNVAVEIELSEFTPCPLDKGVSAAYNDRAHFVNLCTHMRIGAHSYPQPCWPSSDVDMVGISMVASFISLVILWKTAA